MTRVRGTRGRMAKQTNISYRSVVAALNWEGSNVKKQHRRYWMQKERSGQEGGFVVWSDSAGSRGHMEIGFSNQQHWPRFKLIFCVLVNHLENSWKKGTPIDISVESLLLLGKEIWFSNNSTILGKPSSCASCRWDFDDKDCKQDREECCHLFARLHLRLLHVSTVFILPSRYKISQMSFDNLLSNINAHKCFTRLRVIITVSLIAKWNWLQSLRRHWQLEDSLKMKDQPLTNSFKNSQEMNNQCDKNPHHPV